MVLKIGFVCSFPMPSAEKYDFELHNIYSKAFGSIICVIMNASCLARSKF